jgi:hypothetical protein
MTTGPKGEKGNRGAQGVRGDVGKWKLSLAIAALALVTSLGGNVVVLRVARANSLKGREAHTGLCALRNDLVKRESDLRRSIHSTNFFLRKNPDGIPGIPVTLIKAGLKNSKATLANQIATVRVLDGALNCG